MPLLHKKSFIRKRPPAGITHHDKVFYCELTNEAFSDYDEYWERLVLCNAMVWTCELTGRPNLTYQEAVDCETKGMKFLSGISNALKRPLLYLASLTRRGRQSDMSEDVFNYCRDRYFPGETVEAIVNKHWYDCKVIRVICPTLEDISRYEKEMADSDDDMEGDAGTDPLSVIMDGSCTQPITLDDDSDTDSDIQVLVHKSPMKPKPSTPKKKSPEKKTGEDYPPYATYKYEVEEELAWDYKTCKRLIVPWEQIRRNKNHLTRDKCKLFLKISTDLSVDGFWKLKDYVARKYKIAAVVYKDLFPGDNPKFTESKSKKISLSLSPRGKEAQNKQQKKENKETKLRELKEAREEKSNKGSDHSKKKHKSDKDKHSKKLEHAKGKQLELTSMSMKLKPAPTAAVAPVAALTVEEQQLLLLRRQQHFAHLKEMMKQKMEQQKAERKQERDVKKKQRMLLDRETKDWLRPKEDLSCGGHKALPPSIAVTCGVPNHMFGAFLSLLEFINSFSDVLELTDVYPHGISFEMLENAMVTKEVAGVLNDVVQLLIGAVFSLQEEEYEEITADTTMDLAVGLSAQEEGNDQRASAVQFANRASQWATQQHNTSLHQLPLDALTLTEVLRLHLLSSGADNNTNAQWRHMNRGGYKHWDDPGLQFKLDQPEVMKALAVKSIFDMHIDEKIKVLHVLMDQILTYAGVRDRLEEAFEKIREVKGALREHQHANARLEKGEHAARVLKKKEDRLKTLDQLTKKKDQGTAETSTEAETVAQVDDGEPEDEETRKEREESEEKHREKRKIENSKKELEFLEQIMELSAKANPISLGQDRAYRRYWIFKSLPGLFVEDDEQYPGTCCAVPSKDVVDVRPENCSNTLARLQKEAMMIVKPEGEDVKDNIEEKANTSDKENDTSALLGSPHINGAFSAAVLNSPSNNVANIIARVASSPLVLSSPKLSNPKKLLKTANSANGPIKVIQKSAKDQTITKFFTKSPRCEDLPKSLDSIPAVKLSPYKVVLSTLNTISPSKQPLETCDDTKPEEDKRVTVEQTAGVEVFGLCTADPSTCTIHTADTNRPKWSFYYNMEDIDALIGGLNLRGERENSLKENLILFKSTIENNVKNCPVFILNPTEVEDGQQDNTVRKSKRYAGKKGGDGDTNLNFPIGTSIDHILEVTLRDMILEVEEKLNVGMLGRLAVLDREQWRTQLTGDGVLDVHVDTLDWGGRKRITKFKTDIGLEQAIKEEAAVEGQGTTVHMLAMALLQVSQSVDIKYLKPPLAETEKVKQKRLKSERKLRRCIEQRDREQQQHQQQQQENHSDDSDSDSEAGDALQLQNVSDNSLRMPIERWEASLMTCVSFSKVFLHLATLDNSVTWSRSLTKTRCRICRKGLDHEKMLLCDGCDKGHHIYCLKPKIKSIPDGDWFCDKCKPKLKSKSPKKNRTIYVEEEEAEEEEEEEEEVEEEVEEEQEQEYELEVQEEEEEDEDEDYEDDFCVECNTGGELICCDGCPRSFHKECVKLKKVPRGTWHCPHCAVPAKQDEKPKKSKGTSEDKSNKKSDSKSKKESVSSKADGKQKTTKRGKRVTPDDDEEYNYQPSKKRKADRSQVNGTATVTNGVKQTSRRSLLSAAADDQSDLHPSVLLKLLTEMNSHKDAWPFLRPVNRKLAPDYYQLVKKPMDLQTMRDKLNSVKYRSDAEFVADGLLIFQNCQQYNMEDTPEFEAGVTLGNTFKRRVLELSLCVDIDTSDIAPPCQPSRSKRVGTKKHRQSM